MKTKWVQIFLSALPLAAFTVMLIGLLVVRLLFNRVLPVWGTWGLGLLWGALAFEYLLRARLFKQIGGFAITCIAILILAGALIPKDRVVSYPHMASQELVQRIESTWTALYSGNVFKTWSPKQNLIDGGAALAQLDPFHLGKIILFAMLGFALAVVYLFAVDPRRRRAASAAERASQSVPGLTGDAFAPRTGLIAYVQRLGLLFLTGLFFAAQVELLQVLAPSREVSLVGFAESAFGVLAGLLAFIPLHWFYMWLAGRRAKGSSRFNVLGVGVDAVDMRACLELFEEIIQGTPDLSGERTSAGGDLSSAICHLSSGLKTRLPAMTTALGVAGIVEARRNQKLQRILNESVLNTPDGMPLVWLGKLFGYQTIARVYGPDLLRDVCAYGESRGWRHFFYGAAPGIVEKLQEALEQKHPDIEIAGIYCPPFRPLTPEEEDEVVERVNSSRTDIFWIGISTPKQLYFMDHIRSRLNCKIICPVGYAFDVNAGVEDDAPDWAKYSGFQWLHRAIKQPRLWKRYLPDNPRFVAESILQTLHLKKYPMFVHERIERPEVDAEGFVRFPTGIVALSAMTLQGARDRVLNWVKTGQRHYVNICTADTMVQCFDQPELARIVKNAGMATTDGMPLVWLAHYYGLKEATRVYGPDLMLALCGAGQKESTGETGDSSLSTQEPASASSANAAFLYPSQDETGGLDLGGISPGNVQEKESPASGAQPGAANQPCISHFFYGATDEVLEQLKENLLKKFPHLQIAGMYSPPFRPLTEAEKDEVTELINASGADIVWCGLGTPKQDYWVAEFRPRLNCAAILAVGAAFNFHAGHVVQAPRWMMKGGLEWLFRLCVEPKRLWRRYLIGNPRFVMLVIGQLLYRGRKLKKEKDDA